MRSLVYSLQCALFHAAPSCLCASMGVRRHNRGLCKRQLTKSLNFVLKNPSTDSFSAFACYGLMRTARASFSPWICQPRTSEPDSSWYSGTKPGRSGVINLTSTSARVEKVDRLANLVFHGTGDS